MRHLFNSKVEIHRLSGTLVHGTPRLEWQQVLSIVDDYLGAPGEMMCRIDLGYQRIGKDTPMPVTAGRAPDRIGLMCFTATDTLRAGDRIKCVEGPVSGTFEIRTIPDVAAGFRNRHHMEVQVVEVAQNVQGVFPGGEPNAIVVDGLDSDLP